MGTEKKTDKASSRHTSWRSIIGGDILAAEFFHRQAKLLVLIMVLVIFYINNRYECQQLMIRIEEYIATQHSDLQSATTPPYLIRND